MISIGKYNGRQRHEFPIGSRPQYSSNRWRTLLLGSKRVQVWPLRYGRRANDCMKWIRAHTECASHAFFTLTEYT